MSRWTRAQLPIIQQLLMPVVQPGTYQQLLAKKEPQDLPYIRGAKANKIKKSLRDMFRYLKWRQFNLEARSKLRRMVKKGWKGMDLPENFATCMSRMRDGEGGIIHFEGQINHLIPVHNEQYLASEYYKCEGSWQGSEVGLISHANSCSKEEQNAGAEHSAATMADRPEYYYKDICLLPNPSNDQVPRGSAKVSPVEGLFVDTLSPEQ
ncbi:unnamed protein product [Porites lobata]|uniref:Uncharacterized protein n=1 Tax=Porites lobata TaxID=104759 RepID=A0ABN8RBQ5_9CNID|nr:unnamed protein product [Porites lobata]